MSWAETYKINSNMNEPLNKQIIYSKCPEIIRLTNDGEISIPQKAIYKIILISGSGYPSTNEQILDTPVGISTVKLDVNSKVSFTNKIYAQRLNDTWTTLFGCSILTISNNTVDTIMKVYDRSDGFNIKTTSASDYELRPDTENFINIDEEYNTTPYIKELIVKSKYYYNNSNYADVYSLLELGERYKGTNTSDTVYYDSSTRGAILYPVEIL